MDNTTDNLRISALGGFGEIGMNCLTLEVAGKILVVDCGVMFPSFDQPGINIIHPSFEYLVSRRDDLAGIVLTHGHEDHIAGVPYLLEQADLPVYGSRYTIGLVEQRMREFDHLGRLNARIIDVDDVTDIGPFNIRCFPMPHSIIDNRGLLIDTPAGRVLHTGDFKLGMRGPTKGREVLDRLREMASDGVDLMICDSTGSQENEISGDESEVTDTLTSLVEETDGRVYVAAFSSNVERLGALGEIAKNTGRKIALCGRSVITHSKIAAQTDALRLPRQSVIPVEEVQNHPRDRTLVVVSGTQGESRSALSRLAMENLRHLNVESGDLVALSSRFIPGNEVAISRTIDRLLRLGARVVHRDNCPGVHVSGHGSITEIEETIAAVKPRAFIPGHGTYRHLVACSEIARREGVPAVMVLSNGEVARLDPDGLSTTEERLPVGKILIDGGSGVPESAMRDRRLLGTRGLLVISWIATEDGQPVSEIDVILRGVTSDDASPWLCEQIRAEVRSILARMTPELRVDFQRCEEAIKTAIRKFLNKNVSREPYVIVSIYPDP